LVDDVVTFERVPELAVTRVFDCVYSFENSSAGVMAASALRAGRYRGFRPGVSGKTERVWEDGDPTLYEIGLWDDLKRRNRRPYLELLAATAGIAYSGSSPIIRLREDEVQPA